jgi:hypothetical protein
MTLRAAPVSLFWYWINERHNIYLRRSRGEPKPWTDDDIFKDYKFTNVFRELDRGTVWLRENFLEPHHSDDPELLLFNVAWYRMFNLWTTGQLLGWQTNWWSDQVKTTLHAAALHDERVFTNAHIVWSEEGRSKIDAVVDYATAIWNDRNKLAKLSLQGQSLALTFNLLIDYRGIGNFIAYEIVTDLRHTRVLGNAFDIDSWANLGPGAKRGLQRLDMPCKNQMEGLSSMRELLRQANGRCFENIGSHVPSLELRDIEHSLCEFDKYCRVKFGEGTPRMTYNGRK